MTTSKLLVLGSSLVLAAGLAWAGEPMSDGPADAMVEAVEPAAAPAPGDPSVQLPEEDLARAEMPAEPEEQTASEASQEMQAAMPEQTADAPVAEVTPAAEPMVAGEPAPDAESMAAADEAELAAEVVAPAEPPGMTGYDAQGRPGRIHLVVPGDTLWDISDAYLGTPWVWPSIWQDNRDIENPHLIFPGDRIWITPWEMRKVTDAEAEALLSGTPAAAEEMPVATEEPGVPMVEPQIGVVREEQASFFVANRDDVGFVSAEAVEAAASIVSAVVKERVMLGQEDRIWIGLGEDAVEKGDDFTIFRTQEKVFDPETGRMLGYHVNMLGWLEVTEVHPETASAVIRESTLDIEVGDLIMPRKPMAQEIAVQPSPGDVRGQISFFAQQRTLMGTMEYVYLNRGTLDGLEVGSPLQVYRERFMADERSRGERVEVPDRVIADLLVVKAEPEVSVALVQHTEDVLELGDRFRGSDK